MNPEMATAYHDLRGLLLWAVGLSVAVLAMLGVVILLKVLIYVRINDTLSEIREHLSLSRATGQVAEQRRDDAASALGRIETKVADAVNHPPTVTLPTPVPVVVVGTEPPRPKEEG